LGPWFTQIKERTNGTQNAARRAERYRQVAIEYSELANDASSPFLRTHYRQLAEEFRLRAEGELRVLEREGVSRAAGGP
jgi:hypothetical protein